MSNSPPTPPSPDEWRRLYQSAIEVKQLAPWEWMTEADIFAVQNPETEELGFVSVMGMLGEHYAISVYPGPEALYRFWSFEEAGLLASPEDLLEIPQLQASFENRDMLHQNDREVIKSLGFRFRGQHAWPLFRSYQPGFYPWFLEAEEARFLARVLEQVLEVAPRFKDKPELLHLSDEETYLVRVSRQEGDTLVWTDQTVRVPPPEPSAIDISMDLQLLEQIKSLPRSERILEIDLFMSPTGVREKGERPYYPYLLLLVDSQSGMPFGFELLKAEPSLEAMWGMVPESVLEQVARVSVVPKEIRVGFPLLVQLLQPLSSEVGIPVRLVDSLPSLDSAKEALLPVL